MINVVRPDINGRTPQEQIAQIRDYLYQFSEQLQWALSTVEGGSGNEVVLPRKSGNKTADEGVDPNTFMQLKALIIKSADIVEAYYAEMTKLFEASNTYKAISDFGEFMQTTSNALYGDGTGFIQVISDMQQILNEHDEIIMAQLVNGYIRSGILGENNGIPVIGLEVGQHIEMVNGAGENETVFKKFARFTADRLSFFNENDMEVAYISDWRLYINEVKILGDMELGDFLFDTSDGLALIPLAGEDEDE